MNAEGSLSVRLTVRARHVEEVAVASTRPAGAVRALVGRAIDDVARLVPLLFPVCGVAHRVAFARAVEAARAEPADARVEAARDLACDAEAAASHAWQLAIAWPRAAAAAEDVSAVRAARGAVASLAAALFDARSTARSPIDVDGARRAITTLGELLDRLTAREPPLLAIARRGDHAELPAATTPLAAIDLDAVGARLAADDAFADHAALDGAPLDASAYARRRHDGEVRESEAARGRGVTTRLVARLADARATRRRLPAALAALERDDVARAAPAASHVDGAGVASADTARGPLVYRVRVRDGAVADLRLVAPTDWTFHPRGVLRAALLGAGADATLARDAGWLVLALDPCVAWSIEVCDA